MIIYKVRRKSDGKYASGPYYSPTWGVGKVYSHKAFSSAVIYFNRVGRLVKHWDYEILYDDLELVRFDDGVETIIWAGSRCPLITAPDIQIKENETNQYNFLDMIGCAFYYSENPGIDKSWTALPAETKNEMMNRVRYIIAQNKAETMGDITIIEMAKVIGFKVK